MALPFHLKCSLCDYAAPTKREFDIHWLEEH